MQANEFPTNPHSSSLKRLQEKAKEAKQRFEEAEQRLAAEQEVLSVLALLSLLLGGEKEIRRGGAEARRRAGGTQHTCFTQFTTRRGERDSKRRSRARPPQSSSFEV